MTTRYRLLVILTALVAAPPLFADVPLALVGARLVDGTGAAPVEAATVVVADGLIAAAGPASEVVIPPGAEVRHLEGYTLLPGFVNSHVHRGLSASNLRAWAGGGVTTVRDLGCGAQSLAVFRSHIEQTPEMARLVAAGPLITVPDGYPINPFGSSWALPVASVAEAEAAATILFDEQGVDLLKLALESGNGSIPVMTRAVGRALVAAAHARGTMASAHISLLGDLDLALDIGADDLAHMVRDGLLSDAEIARVIAADVAWVPTLELWQCVGATDLYWASRNLEAFAAAGGIVALGTDYEGYTCEWELGMPMTEIRLMAAAGLEPMEILVAATAHGARVANLGDVLGVVAPGRVADLIAVPGNPLDDLEVLADVRLVIHGGTVIRDEVRPLGTISPRRPAGRVAS